MKKILLYLLILCSISTFAQAEFPEGIQVTNAQDNTALKVNVQNASGVINWKYLTDFQKEKSYLSTGLLKNGALVANGDPTKFNITAGIGIISNFDDPENPISTIINFPAFTGITPTYLLTGNITYVAINSTPAVVMQATPFTEIQRRDLIELGAVIHSNLTTINVLNTLSSPSNAVTNQLHDFMDFIGALNLTGNKYVANGANLQLNKSAGIIGKRGVNFANNWKDPHRLSQPLETVLTFRYRTQNGTEGSDRVNIDPALYDLNNVLTAVPNNKFTIQTVVMFQTGLTRILYGQNVYDDLATAKAAVFTRSFVIEPNAKENGIIRAYIIVRNTTTSLQTVADADILEAQKFGGVASGGVALTLANIVTALGYTPENIANKQNSLATDGTGVKYPTLDAVNKAIQYITPSQYGAVGDGVTDDTTPIQNMVSFAGVNKVKIVFPSNKTYVVSGISTPTGLIIEGNNSTIKHTLASTGFSIAPLLGTDIVVSAIGSAQFPATTGKVVSFLSVPDGSLFNKGDILYLNSADMYSWDVTARKAEIVIISGVTGNNLYLTKLLVDSYSTSISIKKMSADVVSIKGLNFTYSGNYLTETATNNRISSLSILGAINPIVECNFENDITSGLSFFSCLNPVSKVNAKNLRNDLSKNYYGYGVVNYGATRGGLINVNANNCRHAFTTGIFVTGAKDIKNGTCIDNTITGIAQNTSSASWDTHAGAMFTTFENCVVQGNSTDADRPDLNQAFAFQDRGFKTSIINPIILESSNGFTFQSINTDYGVDNYTIVKGGYSDSKSNNALFTGISVPAKVGSASYKIRFSDHDLIGYSLSLNTQPSNAQILEISNSTIDFKNIGGLSLLDNTLGIVFKDVAFKNLTTLRLGANNLIDIISCVRENSGASIEPILVYTGATLNIDKYFASAPSYGNSQLIRAINGASNLKLGFVSALNFTPTTVYGNDGAGSFTVTDITKIPINPNIILQGGQDFGGSTAMTIGTVNNAQIQLRVNNTVSSFIRSGGYLTTDNNYFGNATSLNIFGLQVGNASLPAQWSRGTADSFAVARFRNLNASSTGNIIEGFNSVGTNLFKIDYLGSMTLAGNLNLGTLPTTSAGTYDVLTRNTSTGVVEKVSSTVLRPAFVPLDEGNGIGYVIANRTAANYGNVGLNAVDLGFSDSASSTRGATAPSSGVLSGIRNTSSGQYSSISGGVDNIVSGQFSYIGGGYLNTSSNSYSSVSGGYTSTASGQYSTVTGGEVNTASGNKSNVSGGTQGVASGVSSSVIGGENCKARSYGEMSGGLFPTDYTPTSATTWQATDRIFNIGNGTSGGALSNAFTILKNGLATLPSVTNALIEAETTGKAVVTKEYVNRVYTVATLPTPTSNVAYATVSDALAPSYMATVVGGGAVVTPVFYNGTNWVAH